MARFARTDGILLESVGHLWAAFCPASGETLLLNDESASVLEVLESGAADTAAICTALAEDTGMPAESLESIINACWSQMISAGLVRQLPA